MNISNLKKLHETWVMLQGTPEGKEVETDYATALVSFDITTDFVLHMQRKGVSINIIAELIRAQYSKLNCALNSNMEGVSNASAVIYQILWDLMPTL